MNKKQISGWIVAITGESVESLAVKHNYRKGAFYDVIRRHTISPKVRKIIADAINKPESEIWPETAKKDEN